MKAFQIKIAIKNSKPPIWRRAIIPAGITFSQLSMILNEIMGWSGYHLFEYEFYHLELKIVEGAEEFEGWGSYGFDYLEASETYIREYLEKNDWFTYIYDLGDGWAHRVTIEKVIEDYEYDYPQVIKYKGDCPIEDCGGIEGYYDCMSIISDEQNPEYEERLSWMKSQGYPNEYDMTGVNNELKNRYFYKWGKGEKRIQEQLYQEQFSGKYGLNATKKDKNNPANIIVSSKHQVRNSLQMMADMIQNYNSLSKIKPQSLKDIFEDYEKEDIKDIAQEKGVKGITMCNKSKLIDKVVEHMLQPHIMENYFVWFHDDEIREFEKAAGTTGIYESEQADLLMSPYRAAYIGMFPDGGAVVPKDVADAYQRICGKSFDEKRARYSYFMCCLQTSAILYGIVPMNVFMQLVGRNPDFCMSESEIKEMMESIPPEFAEYALVKDKIYHKELYPNDRGLLTAQGNKSYYIPTYREIMDLGTKEYLSESRELQKLEQYFVSRLGVMESEAHLAVKLMQVMMCEDCAMQEIFDLLDNFEIRAETDSQINQMMRLINEMWNNTRMLLNRGHTPNEIAAEQKQRMVAPLAQQELGNVIAFDKAKKNKLYPNDPCPCGSGKKYKNCCKGK